MNPSISTFPARLPAAEPVDADAVGSSRRRMFRESDRQHYDVAILGAGISGARIHHELSRRGHRVITIDRGDIAGATSQASGMMIWGGLLYMKDFDCFLPSDGVRRVWFEFLIRHRDPGFDTPRFMELLGPSGVRVHAPRYPLLHEQPFFREGVIAGIGRYPSGTKLPDYANLRFPVTDRENRRMIKLPNFTQPDKGLIDFYHSAFAAALESL